MKKFLLVLLLSVPFLSFSQELENIITELEVLRVEKHLSSDDMRGRKAGTPGIEKAAAFIQAEFGKSGLAGQVTGLRQEFSMYRNKVLSISGEIDGVSVKEKNVIVFSQDTLIKFTGKGNFEVVTINADSNLVDKAEEFVKARKRYIVFVDSTAHAANFRRIGRVDADRFSKHPSVVFILSSNKPSSINIEIKQEVKEIKLANVVGVLPGNGADSEYVVFSAHYDHLGVGRANAAGDSIYNGANDDASGITALIMLSRYFGKIKNNKRTLIFAAFTAEEIGGFGSKYFSLQQDPAKIVAMFNIEMIGTESKWGINSAYITGFEKSDMAKILQKNLQGSKFSFQPDPYPEQKLFYRSDNASLATLGVPAHTISTSKMDAEPYYHSQDDEIETLDLQNMTEIIKAIAISSRSIIAGQDTPTRVEK